MIFRSAIIFAACLFLSCGVDDATREVTRIRIIPPQTKPAVMTDAERFGFEAIPASATPATLSAMFDYALPAGWSLGPSRPMRDLNLLISDSPEIECYVMTLNGDGGGLEANVNRWRAQMGGSPVFRADTDSRVGSETRPTILMFGATGTVVELRGTYTGVDGQTHSDYALLGVICLLPDRTVFIKMTGPAAQVSAQKKSFLDFSKSLRPKP